MMKVAALVVVAALAVAAVVAPEPSQPVPLPPSPQATAPYTVCPLGEAARRTTALTFLEAARDTTISIFSAGDVPVEAAIEVSEEGTSALELSEITGLALAPVLVPQGTPPSAVETILQGGGVAAAPCQPGSPDAQVLLGGSTAEGHTYTISLANPFAGAATVDIAAASEVGVESEPALSGIVVPPRSLIAVDLHSILPGRQAISAAIVTHQGRVVPGAVHDTGSDISATAGLIAALDWYLPAPALEGVGRTLVLFAPGTTEAPFQIDVYGPDGLLEAAYEDVIPAQSQITIPVGDLLEGAGAIRVLSANPVAAALRFSGDGANAVVPGSSAASPSWRLSGAGRLGDSVVHVFNPGDVEVTAELQSGTGRPITSVAVPPQTLVQVPITARPVGGRLEADGDVVVTWTTNTENGLAGDLADPLAPG
ncbi:MAG TPA: DUF5719 family protein [Acidimicrobiia bacterium]|jgi:hypothetical protein